MAITPLTLYTGQVPLIGQTQAVFDQNAGDILVYLSDFGTDINGRAVEIDAVGVSADADATTATTKAGEANTSAINALASETASELSEWESEASRLTAVSYATEAEDVVVNIVTSDGDGTYTYTPQTGVYSALHHELKAATFNPVLYATLDSPALVNPTINGIAQSGYTGLKNLIINGNPTINQRGYVSATATTGANQYTLDRWRVVTLGQALTFSTTANVTTMTLPAGGIEQVIEGLNFQSGTYTISFVATGDTVCTVNAVTKASGDTFTLTGGTNATVKLSSALGTGTVKLIQVEEGSTATNFEQSLLGDTLARCQRYYWKPVKVNYYLLTRYNSTTNFGRLIDIQYPNTMRVQPSVSYSTSALNSASNANDSVDGITIVGTADTATSSTRISNFIADAEL